MGEIHTLCGSHPYSRLGALEANADSKLQFTVIRRSASDDSYIRRIADIRARGSEIRAVQHIEGFCTKLEGDRLSNLEVLEDTGIPRRQPGSEQQIGRASCRERV